MTRPRKSTMIRAARKATAARKRAALEFQAPNKKAPSKDGAYNFHAAGAPSNAPVAIHSHTPRRCMNNEFVC